MDLLSALNAGLRRYLVARGARSRHVQLGEHRVHFYELRGHGRGLPILLVHGLAGSANGFYKVLFPLARRSRRVIALDLPGNGFSRPCDPALGPAALLEVLEAFLDEVVGERAWVVGSSLGGAMTVTLASRRPDKVAALALLAPAGARVADQRAAEVLQSLQITNLAQARALTRRLFHRPRLGALLLAGGMRRMYTTPAVKAVLAQTGPDDFLAPELLGSLKMPVLLVWGQSEKLLPVEGIEYFRSHLPPTAHIHEVEGFGHIPQMESPRALMRYLDAFAEEHQL